MADSKNPIDQALSGGANPIDSSLGATSAASSSANPIDSALTGGPATPRPDNGNPAPAAPPLVQQPDEPFYKKAFDFLNTPITEDFGLPTSRAGAGGFERGVEHIVSGLTSPLSLALTAATFGGGGLLESAGASTLREAGLTAAEIADVSKASEIATNVAKEMPSAEGAVQQALTAAGHDPALVTKAREALGPVNLEDSFAEPEVQTALQKAGFSDKEVEDLSKASETIQKAKADFSPVEDAVRASGADVDKWKQAQSILYDNGLTEHDLLGGDAVERGAFKIIRNTVPDMPVAAAARAAKTANTVMQAGFTYQQLQQAAAISPQFFDALKNGDTDNAWEYGTEALAGGVLGVMGTTHALHSAGELFQPLLETNKFRPNDEWLAIDRANKEREALHAVAEAQGVNIDQTARKLLGHDTDVYGFKKNVVGESPELKAQKQLELATAYMHTTVGGDQVKAAAWHNALAEAAGKEDRLPTPILGYHGSPADFEGPPKTDGLGAHFTGSKELAEKFRDGSSTGHVIEANLGLRNPLRIEDHGGSHADAQVTIKDFVKQGVLPDSFLQDIDSRIYKRSQEIAGPDGEIQGPELAAKRNAAWEQANTEELEKVKSYLQSKGYDGLVYDNKVEGGGDSYVAFKRSQISPVRPDNGLPPNIAEQISSGVFAKMPAEYQNRVLMALKRVASDDLSDKELAASKYLRDEQAKNFQFGQAHDMLHNEVENYMTRAYKDENPEGKVITAATKAGKFATNVTMARQRVYDSTLTAILKSPKELDLDPIKMTAKGRADLIKAAANKQLIDTLRDKFTRASDGRPAVVLSGSGQVVHGPDGEDPTTMIQPDRVRKIQVADNVVQQLTKSGDLERFLENGSLRDITPKIRPEGIDAAIAKLQERNIGSPIKFDEEGNSLNRKAIEFLKDIQSGKRSMAELKEYNDNLKKMYAWDPQDYINMDNSAMKGWNFVTNDPNGNSVVVRSDIRVHPEFAEYLKNRLGLEPSALASHPISKAALSLGTKSKEILLSMSPFHMAQLALRGVMVGMNPFTLETPDILNGERVNPADPNSPSIIRKGVENGLTTGTDYKALQEHSEGVSTGGGLVRKIPGVGPTIANSLDWYQNFLFKRFMPALKANAMEKMFHDYQNAHPDWSVDRVAKAAALHTNDTFGGINWKAMGRSATTQDWGRLLLLAPDWLESEMRSAARLFNKDDGGLGRFQVARMAMGVWGISRVLNYMSTGNFHNEAPFGLVTKNKDGKEIVYSIRTLPTDLLHAAADPTGFIKGRLSPGVNLGMELTTGRDHWGRKLQPQDLYADVFRNMSPIPFQSIGQAVSGTGPQVGNTGQIVKALGGTAQTYASPAQKMAADLAASHTEDGPIDPSQMARHRMVMNFEDKVRSGEMPLSDLMRLTYQTDQLKESELKKIETNLKATKGMDSSMASMYTRASRLPATQYLQLYDQMNSSERAAMVPLTLSVRRKYLNKAKKDMTPTERAQDPTFNRLLNMVPNQPTEPSAPPTITEKPPIVPGPQASVGQWRAVHPVTGHELLHDGTQWLDAHSGEIFGG